MILVKWTMNQQKEEWYQDCQSPRTSLSKFFAFLVEDEPFLSIVDSIWHWQSRVFSFSHLLRVSIKASLSLKSWRSTSPQQGASWCIQVHTSQTQARKRPKEDLRMFLWIMNILFWVYFFFFSCSRILTILKKMNELGL